ncbi:MAG: YdcF family protein [Candidatus Paceibacterota bacterium]|jgi:uncharacterized SAM-binding protein YcdF (DUF218 family)
MSLVDEAVMIFAEAYDKRIGELSQDLVSRLERGLEVWQEDKSRSILVTGGVHHPSKDRVIAHDMKDWLAEHGVPEKLIYVADGSYDTWTNFTDAADIIQKRKWKRIFLVSNLGHIKRICLVVKILKLFNYWMRDIDFVEKTSAYLDKQDVVHETISWLLFFLGLFPPVKKFIYTRIFSEYRHLKAC